MKNIIDNTNSDLFSDSKVYKNTRMQFGAYGFYNTLINKVYAIDFSDTGSYMTANICFNI
jgi:hypothetical protein